MLSGYALDLYCINVVEFTLPYTALKIQRFDNAAERGTVPSEAVSHGVQLEAESSQLHGRIRLVAQPDGV